ncbi:hypothetical protein ASPWEDRAFT_65851 [Aspergillus wentii DTO 134E9]|uniref:Uncharacterized protein n=1 Tax=Aspergillus wentii DTO 134E9 TaxID=1073089 RepID=A0A1L9RVM2_ASPWE|nr:uncharacterized protein ASPWEDRAFT_65851 [Aspergillus wentii DTO 134E9]KAI9928833.1 hypothetical protein MW887_002054 [Aspergillus wentii]OJJ38934.1 hypothetical protein ASPWEDRAFT_65851 [Aspergillus wentii DTO 134E9]
MSLFSESSGFSSSNSSHISPNIYRITPQATTRFLNINNAVAFIRHMFDQYPTHQQHYICLSDVTETQAQDLAKKRQDHSLPSMRVTYFPADSSLIIKLASPLHERTCDLFHEIMIRQYTAAGITSSILMPSGTATRQMVGGVSKQPDKSWVPWNTRNDNDYPSFVLEVGDSESLDRLRLDARIWLDTSGGCTRLVLLVSVDRARRTIVFERWQRLEDRNLQNNQQTFTARRVQRVTVDYAHGNVVAGAPLLLPMELMFDSLPIVPADSPPANTLFAVPAAELQNLAALLF